MVRSHSRPATCGALVLLCAATSAAADDLPPGACSELYRLQSTYELNVRLEDRFATLDGRSFFRPPERLESLQGSLAAMRRALLECPGSKAPRLLKWNLVARGYTETFPTSPPVELAQEIVTLYGALGKVDPKTVTVAQVGAAASRSGLSTDPTAAAFIFNYLFSPNRAQVASAAGRNLTMDQIAAATQYLGYLGGLRYDYGKQLTLNRPIISPSRVNDAAAAQLSGGAPRLKAGDCGDVANAQADLLGKLGARDVIITSYSLIEGLHATVIARDPNFGHDPSKRNTYYEFNYSLLSRVAGREGAELFQMPGWDDTWTDVGPGIYLNRPNGKTVAFVPTSAGKLYAEVAGMDIHEIEPLARATSNLIGAQLEIPGSRSVQSFAARDDLGNLYAGAAFNQAWAPGSSFAGAAGLVTSARRTVEGLALADIYFQIDQHARTPLLRLAPWAHGRLDATLIFLGTYAIPIAASNGNMLGADAALLLDTSGELDFGSPGSALSGRARIEAQVLPGLTNISGATPTVFLNYLAFIAEGRRWLRRSAGGLSLFAGATVLLDSLAPRLVLGVGLDAAKFGVRLEVRGRASSDDPTYKEGSLRMARAAAAYSIGDALRISIMTEVREGVTSPTWIVTGAFGWRL